MTPETALAIAGPDAHLVRRTRVVDHVYVGPLTPSGRFAPRAARTVCRAHTRQLRAVPLHERSSSLARCAAASSRMCARCAACLDRDRDRSRQVTSGPVRRDEVRRTHADTTKADIAVALEFATTPAEVDAAAWLSLLLFDVAGCNDPFDEHARTWPALHDQVHAARSRVRGFPEQYYVDDALQRAGAEAARAARIAGAQDARKDRERRIEVLGFDAATPRRRGR